jgi:PAS domain S-box-containing protein
MASDAPQAGVENGTQNANAPLVGETGELLSEVLAQLNEGVAMLTESGVVVSWTLPAAQLTGYAIAEINHTGFWHLFEPPATMMTLIQRARQGTAVDERLILVRADHQRIPVGVRCFSLRHAGASAAYVVVVLRDLSALEALQNQLLQNERLSILGRLAGAVSHEIRNPLTAIFLQADILEDELDQSEEGGRGQVRRSVRVIKEEVSRLHDLVEQYLSLARLSNLQREPVRLSTYLDAFGVEMRDRLTVRGIALKLAYRTSLGQVALHYNSFRRVLLNLVNNAIEAMPGGGTITIRARRRCRTMCLEIIDTGHGIPNEQMPLLFSPLHTTKAEGTGLGLYLAKEIVAAHEGDIAVNSKLGVGTTFMITLPLYASK